MDHNAVLESLDDDITDQDVYKYVDHLTLDKEIDKETTSLIEYLPDNRECHVFKPRSTQENFTKLPDCCEEKGLKINGKKTQLSISSIKQETKAWISLKDGTTLYSSDKFKLLGFMFSKKSDS